MAGDAKKKKKEEEPPAGKKETAASGTAKDKDTKIEGVDQEASKGNLSRLRQRRWPIFFIIYVASCAWLVCMYDACDVKPSKLQDCGHSGIQYTECATIACFVKGGGKMLKKQVKIDSKGEPLGLSVAEAGGSDQLTVTSVAGAVAEYNSQVESAEDRILVGDSITKVGSSTKPQQMKKALLVTDKTITLSVQRSKLPWYLKWLGSKADFATSPGYQKWSRCCYNENVPDGKPHCHKSRDIKIEDAVAEAWARSRAALVGAYTSFVKDPQKYLKSFVPKL